MLEDVVARCDPDEIESVFSLQAVLREERLLLLNTSKVDPLHYSALYDAYES